MRRLAALAALLLTAVPAATTHAASRGTLPPITRGEVNRFIADVKAAISEERIAVQRMLTYSKDGYDGAESHLRGAEQDIYQPEWFLGKDVSFSGPNPVPLLGQIHDADDAAYHDLYDAMAGDNYGKLPSKATVDKAVARLTAALAQKKRVLSMLDEIYVRAEPGTGVLARRCSATKEFDVFAVPSGFAGSYADVYPHGVPRDAKNIKFTFVDTATGKAPAAQLYPGQTWSATNKGFLPDGRLDIHVDVTGTGFGAQDANHKHWKVVVTYDC